MSDVIVRSNEACAPDTFLLWDSIWNPALGLADFALAGGDETQNRGGLTARRGLATAVTLCLFTDRRIGADHPLAWLADGDPRGYWGDGIDVRADLSETPLGSYLWLLERAPLTVNGQPVTRWAEQFALDALAPLKAQGAVVRIEAKAAADNLQNRLDLTVNLYGRDGQNVFSANYLLLWRQVVAPAAPPGLTADSTFITVDDTTLTTDSR